MTDNTDNTDNTNKIETSQPTANQSIAERGLQINPVQIAEPLSPEIVSQMFAATSEPPAAPQATQGQDGGE
jgi:hypothetical protein